MAGAFHERTVSAAMATPRPDPGPDGAEADLIARCRAGDSGAWRELYRAHFGYVARLARSLGTPPAEHEDVIQEVFSIAFRKLDTFQHGQITTWLYRICANVVTDHHRRRRVRGAFARLFTPEKEVESTQPTPDAQLAQAQARDRVGQILERMAPKKREVFVLFEIEGLSGDAIAAQVGCSTATVWTRLFHARKDFAKLGAQLNLLQGEVV
jgi:RNA polymerase sigma-70 factor (ECF subfamily)